MSIRKRQWTTAAGEDRTAWVVDYVDNAGKRRLKTFARKKEADAFEAGAKVEIRQGVHIADTATVTIEEAARLWLETCDRAGLERSTLAQYRQHVKLHIVPMIGAVKLSKIAVPVIREFQDRLSSEGRSPAMVKRVTVSLGAILGDAQERGLVIRNAVHEASARKATTARTAQRRAKRALAVGVDIPSQNEIAALLKAAEGPFRPFLITAIFTGMRASELRGLSWQDVDLDAALVHVRRRADQYRAMGMPKSDAGQRTIPVPPMVVNALKEWKLACPKGELGLVFPNGEGNVEFHANLIARGLIPLMIRAGLTGPDGKARYTGLHAFRHWFASWCIARKADGGLELSPKAVQARMGHSSIQVTFDTYGHLFPATNEAAALAEAEGRLMALAAT